MEKTQLIPTIAEYFKAVSKLSNLFVLGLGLYFLQINSVKRLLCSEALQQLWAFQEPCGAVWYSS